MSRTFDQAKHCGARRQSCDRKLHATDWDGTCGHRGERGHAGAPCCQTKGWGTNHNGTGNCKLHGGVGAKGERHAAKELAALALEELGVQVDVDPVGALLARVREAHGNCIFLLARARELGHALVGPVQRDARDGDSYELYEASEEVRAVVRLYGEWFDRSAKVSKMAIDAGIAQQRLELEKQRVDAVVSMLNASLEAAANAIRIPKELLERDDVSPAARERFRVWAEATRREARHAGEQQLIEELKRLEAAEL